MKKLILGAISILIDSDVSAQDTDADRKDIYIDGQLVDFRSSKQIHMTFEADTDFMGFSVSGNRIKLYSSNADYIESDWNKRYQDSLGFIQRGKGLKVDNSNSFELTTHNGYTSFVDCIDVRGKISLSDDTDINILSSTYNAGDEISIQAPKISAVCFFTKTPGKVLFLNSGSSSSWLKGFYFQETSKVSRPYGLGFFGAIDFAGLSTGGKEFNDSIFQIAGTNQTTFILENPNI